MTPAYTVVLLEVSSLYQTNQSFLQDVSVHSTYTLLEVKMENPVCDSLL